MHLLQVCTLQEVLDALRVVTRLVAEEVAEEAEEEEDVVVDSPVVSIPSTVADEEQEEDVVVDGPSRDCAAAAGIGKHKQKSSDWHAAHQASRRVPHAEARLASRGV